MKNDGCILKFRFRLQEPELQCYNSMLWFLLLIDPFWLLLTGFYKLPPSSGEALTTEQQALTFSCTFSLLGAKIDLLPDFVGLYLQIGNQITDGLGLSKSAIIH